MGIVMLLGIAVAMVYVRSARFFLLRIICVLAIGIMCVSVVLLGSRTAMLGLAAYAVFSALQRSRTAILRYAVLVLGIVLVVNFRGELLEEQVRDAFDERMVEVYERGGIEELSSYRLNIWRMFPETIKRHSWVLITGSGFQNADPVIHGAVAMHNNYLHVIVELGMIGFLIYANWLLKIYRSLRHAESQTVDTRGMVLAEEMKLAFMAILVTMLVSETLYAQAAMATLTGQIVFLVYLAALGPNLTPREVTS
jgi:O-antigen ligase